MRWLEKKWYRISIWSFILLPASFIFWLTISLRRALYASHILRAIPISIPVVVVGNITVGGTGKTPLVIWLARLFKSQGMRPGIISRGYGRNSEISQPVLPHSNPLAVGDEPVLLARRSECPVWVGKDRIAAAHALLSEHPEVDIIISDDGLQHYRLRRDVEVAVIDAKRGFGNGLLLPAGPLREPASRLRTVDAIVINGPPDQQWQAKLNAFSARLAGDLFYNLIYPERQASAQDFLGKRLHAIAGIGHPERFFEHLKSLGLHITSHPFPDHYRFRPQDLQIASCDVIFMTEKDAVKCEGLGTESCWVLPVSIEVESGLEKVLLAKLRKHYGSKVT